MATMTIRNLDDDIKAGLRIRAARHNRSMEQEVRDILRRVLGQPETDATGLGQLLRQRFAPVATDLPLPRRSLPRTIPLGSDNE